MQRTRTKQLLLILAATLYALSTIYQSPIFIADTSLEKIILSSSKAIAAISFACYSYRNGFAVRNLVRCIAGASVAAACSLILWFITEDQIVAYICCSMIGMSSGLGALLLATALSLFEPKISKRLLILAQIAAVLLLPTLHFQTGLNDTAVEIIAYILFIMVIALALTGRVLDDSGKQSYRLVRKDYPPLTNERKLLKLLKSSYLLKIIITLVGACLFAFCFGLFETVAIFNAVSISNSPETALIIALVMVALYVTFLTLRKDITMDISFIIVGFLFIAAIFWALITGRFTLSLFTALSIGIYVYYQAVWFFQFDIAHSQKIAVSLMAGVTVFVIALSRVLGRVIAEIFFTRVGPDEVIQTISPWALSIFVLALFFLLILMVKIIKTSIKDNKMALESFSETEISIRECLKTFVKKYHLTDRETQVLQEYALGRSMPYISKKMYLSENTIKTYISRAYAKLGVHNKQELKSMIEQELKEMPGS